jgi:hypothetical protein
MATPPNAERLTTELTEILEETFERVQGIYLDRGTSLFETLASVSAAEASRPISRHCASIAAQVHHTHYYIQVLTAYMAGTPPSGVDWPGSWSVESVTEAEWDAARQSLEASYRQLRAALQEIQDWGAEEQLSGALAIIVHTAYHLGEIRQALGVLRP